MSKLLQAVREAILRSGKTRYAISKATGIDQSQLSKLMKGRSGLSFESLETLVEFLDLEIILCPKHEQKG